MGVDHRAALDQIDEGARDLGPHRRAAPAAAEPPELAGDRVADVGRAVDHDRAGQRAVVDAGVEASKAQRVAILADVARSGHKQAETRLVRVVLVRERRREVLAAAPSMRHQFTMRDCPGHGVEHPETRLDGRQRVIDERQEPFVRCGAERDGTPVSGEGGIQCRPRRAAGLGGKLEDRLARNLGPASLGQGPQGESHGNCRHQRLHPSFYTPGPGHTFH